MSKRKSIQQRSRGAKAVAVPPAGSKHLPKNQPAGQEKGGMFSQAAIRETVESVVIAFVLAFLFRTFEAEAFVIPTGSMAPTLMGRHKDYECPVCGHWYQISASEEVDQDTNRLTGHYVGAGTCPMCRYTADLRRSNPQGRNYPSYSGDRILVGKFAYQFAEPRRWDVAVFKYPGNAVTNYIKRIVGLPGETVIIRGGDIYVAAEEDDQPPNIARKPPEKVLAMLQLVFDNQYAPSLAARGFPSRWEGAEPPGAAGRFDAVDPDGCLAFQTDGSKPEETWLRYLHRVPSFDDWQLIGPDGQLPPHRQPEPQFILDFTAYNTHRGNPLEPVRGDVLGSHWVGDLALECTVKVLSDTGQVILQLTEGGERFQVRFDVATGQAALSIAGKPDWQPKASTRLQGPGTYHVRLANCDDKLYVWIDNRYVEFDVPTTYAELGNGEPTPADLEPAAVGSRACAMQVTDLKLWRDVYYIAASSVNGMGNVSDYQNGRNSRLHNGQHQEVFPLQKDQFFMLGDNSLRSKDGRLWSEPGPNGPKHYVERDALIGKAILIYWPHSWDRIPGTPIPFPFFPNFAGMGLVR